RMVNSDDSSFMIVYDSASTATCRRLHVAKSQCDLGLVACDLRNDCSITTSDSHTSLQYRVLYHAAARVEQSYQPAIRSLSVLSLRTLIVWAWNNTRPLCPAAVLSWRRTHPMRHRLLCAALLCATLLFALLAPSTRSSAQPGDDVIRPDQVVLQP